MKTHFLFPIIFVGLFLASCDKSKDPTPQDLITGSWTITNLNASVKVGNQTLVAYLKSNGLSESEAQQYNSQVIGEFEQLESTKIDFRKDGTYTSENVSSSDPGKWELSADGKTLTTDKGVEEEIAFNVVSLTSSEMNLASTFESEDFGSQPFAISIEMKLTK